MDHLLNIVKEFKNLEKQEILKYLYRNESDKAYFAHDAEYSDSKYLEKGFIWDKILKDRAYKIARNCGYDGYQKALASKVYTLFDKKTGLGISANEQLAKELHKPIIKKFNRNVYARFKDNIWTADLTEMESLFSKNKNVKYLLYLKDVFTKYAWVKPLEDEKGKTVFNGFIEIAN